MLLALRLPLRVRDGPTARSTRSGVSTATTPPRSLARWPAKTPRLAGAREAKARAGWRATSRERSATGSSHCTIDSSLERDVNIDHIFVAPTGVWVVDTKAYKGKVVRREIGPLWRRDNELYIGGRNRTSLAKGVDRQVDAVIAALRGDQSLHGTDVHAALCLIESEWRLLDLPFQLGNVWVMYPGALKKRLRKSGPLARETMELVARRLELSLPPA